MQKTDHLAWNSIHERRETRRSFGRPRQSSRTAPSAADFFLSVKNLKIALKAEFWHILCDRRGNVAVSFALMCMPITLTVGGAIDYSRAVHFKAEVQGVVDSAALAGATAYVNASSQTLATSVVSEFMKRRHRQVAGQQRRQFRHSDDEHRAGGWPARRLPGDRQRHRQRPHHIPRHPDAVDRDLGERDRREPGGQRGGEFLRLQLLGMGQEHRLLVPDPAGIFDTYVPPNSALVAIWSNAGGVTAAPANVAASQKIVFALVNITGGLGGNYGANQYGGAYLSTHTFYSSLPNPSRLE